MKAELKVYLSHTDAYRIQLAAQTAGMSTSTFIRTVCLGAADAMGVKRFDSLLEGQREFFELPKVQAPAR